MVISILLLMEKAGTFDKGNSVMKYIIVVSFPNSEFPSHPILMNNAPFYWDSKFEVEAYYNDCVTEPFCKHKYKIVEIEVEPLIDFEI